MTEPDRRLSLELTQAATPIRGLLRDEHGHMWTFSSWLGLLVALTAAIPGTDTHQTDDPRSAPSIGGATPGAELLTATEDD